MNDYVRVRFNCIEGVHFFVEKPEVLPLTAKETAFVAGVNSAYDGLKDYMVDQGTGNRNYREGATERRLLVDSMRKMNSRIAAIAKSIAEEGVDPGIAEKFRLPRHNRAYLVVVGTALGFANEAEPIEALFTERGMEATFVADLRAMAAAFQTASGVRVGGLAVQTTGTAGLELLAKEGLKFVRLLRPLISEKLKANPALLASWKLVSRVARGGGAGSPVLVETPEVPGSGS